jgi:hypothetical protein
VAVPARSASPARTVTGWRSLAVTVAVFVVALLVLGREAQQAGFEADEADYVATSRYFGYLFWLHDVTRAEWGSNHWTRTQPPLTRYIIGLWLTASGHDLESLNQPYVSTASSFEVNRRKGRVPDDDVLALARQPMVLLGAGAVTLLFGVTALLAGPVAGLTAAALALTSPFLRYTFVHAWAEAPLSFFLLLAAFLAAHGIRQVVAGRSWIGSAVGLGIALGLASATKLTGLVGVAAVIAGAMLVALLAWRGGDRSAVGRLAGWAALSGALAVAVFVAVNPYLWHDPAAGFLGMLEERRAEMAFQQQQWPEFAVLGLGERPWLTIVGSTRVGPWAELPLIAVPVGIVLGALGLASIGRRYRGSSLPESAAAIVLVVWLAGYTAAIVAGLGLSYPRYFLPSCLLLLPFIGVGAAATVSWLTGLVRRVSTPA